MKLSNRLVLILFVIFAFTCNLFVFRNKDVILFIDYFHSIRRNDYHATATATSSNMVDQNGGHCIPWNSNASAADEWWTHHPDWDIESENATHVCFVPISDVPRATFLRYVYDLQWHGNCSEDVQTHQISSGFGASFGVQLKAFLYAISQKRPYQMTKHWPGMQWLYVPRNKTSWAWCESTDMNCYLLPLSNCPPVYGRNDALTKGQGTTMPYDETNMKLWTTWFLGRFKHRVRQRVYHLIQEQFPPLLLPCTVMHVRRADAGLSVQPYRRYAALSEYIEKGHVVAGENVVLLTDDDSTIDEAMTFHNHVNWLYVKRPRRKGAGGGFDGHIPSNDGAYDMIMILAELKYASKCTKLIHGNSGFVNQIEQEMIHAGTNYTRYWLQTRVSKQEAQQIKGKQRGDAMLASIWESNQKLHNNSSILMNNNSAR